jgi:uncharacterized protein (TIGR02271 family)
MIDRNSLQELQGRDAIGPDGDKIGSVESVYVDDATGEPAFALVNTGLFGLRSSFVPLTDATYEEGTLRLAHSKDKVKDAPNVDPDGHLSPEEEAEIFRDYGLHGGTAERTDAPGAPTTETGTAPTAQPAPTVDTAVPGRTEGTEGWDATGGDAAGRGTVGHDTSGPTTDDAMTRSEEELRVGKTEREVGRARLRKHVVTEHVTKTVPVQREEVRVEREPITDENVDRATGGPAISEEEHEVVLHAEEPVVDKRVVPKERVRLDKDVVTEQEQVEDDVRREEIDVVDEDSRR